MYTLVEIDGPEAELCYTDSRGWATYYNTCDEGRTWSQWVPEQRASLPVRGLQAQTLGLELDALRTGRQGASA